jgi:hypothetical protein
MNLGLIKFWYYFNQSFNKLLKGPIGNSGPQGPPGPFGERGINLESCQIVILF